MSVHQARLQQRETGGVRCLTCERRCLLTEGQAGWCRTRQNQAGQLVTLTYGLVSSLSANPIEKKPLYHFHPGTVALTVGSWGCNFGCPWCQNWRISKHVQTSGRFLSPQEFVEMAQAQRCQGTSVSLNEPTLSLEWTLEMFSLARREGLYNTLVTNGYMTAQALALLVGAGLDAMNVDLKGDADAVRRYCGADVEKVWRNCRLAREKGVWLEITTLVIPGVNDQDGALQGIARRIVTDLGADVPWHVSGYYPAYRFTAPPTPLPTLERAWQIGKDAGLEFIYLGNVLGHHLEHTYCPGCGVRLVARRGLRVEGRHQHQGRCPSCGRTVPGVWGA